jgi:hypothetical protein
MIIPHDNVVDLRAYRKARALQRVPAAPLAPQGGVTTQFPMTMFPSAVYSPMFMPVVWVPYWMPAMPSPARRAAGAEDA